MPRIAAVAASGAIRRRLAQGGVEQRVRDPSRDALDLLVAAAPDVPQDDIGFNAVDHRERTHQPAEAPLAELRLQRTHRMAQNLHAVAAAIGLFRQLARALQRGVLQGELERRTQLRLILLEAREGLDEELLDALAAIRNG